MKIEMDTMYSKFDLDKKVYAVLGPDRYCHSEITAYRSFIFNGRLGIMAIPNAVRLSDYTLTDYFEDIEQNAVPFKYLTDDEEQAKKWVKVTPAEFSDEEWFKAIGQRPTVEEMMQAGKDGTSDSEDSLEESELGVCCANLSHVRDLLIKCKEHKGLTGWEVERLQWMCDNVCHDFPEDALILKNILKQLNVKWS